MDEVARTDDGLAGLQKMDSRGVVYPVGSCKRRKDARKNTTSNRQRQRANGQTIGGTHKRRARHYG
jgi:hypothetical protein